MHVQVEDVSAVEKRIKVEVPWEQVRERLDVAYKQLGRDVNLRGFRKGKVPRSVLERMFGSKVDGEIARDLVRESFVTAIKEHDLDAIAEPVVEEADIRRGEPFRCSARVEVRPPVRVKTFAGLALERHQHPVREEEVDAALERKRLDSTEFVAILDRDHTASTDVIEISMQGRVGRHKVDRPQMMIDLSRADLEPLPGLAQALTGLPLAAKDHLLLLQLPADAEQKELAGKTARLSISILAARKKVVPALDDDFAKDTGEADSLKELRDKMRERLVAMAEKHALKEVREAARKELVKHNPVELSPSLVERGIDSQAERLRMQLGMSGLDVGADYFAGAELRERLREPAEEDIRGQLLLEKLAEDQGLEVSDAEVEARIAEIAEASGKQPPRLKAELERDGRLDSVRWSLLQNKALDLVVSRATITEAKHEHHAHEHGGAEELGLAATRSEAPEPDASAKPTKAKKAEEK